MGRLFSTTELARERWQRRREDRKRFQIKGREERAKAFERERFNIERRKGRAMARNSGGFAGFIVGNPRKSYKLKLRKSKRRKR